jgi:hypothetical protein
MALIPGLPISNFVLKSWQYFEPISILYDIINKKFKVISVSAERDYIIISDSKIFSLYFG